MAECKDNCPVSVPVPIKVRVNTTDEIKKGNTTISHLSAHSLSATNVGYTKISKFTFTPALTSNNLTELLPTTISTKTVVFDFGDGTSLSATNDLTVSHKFKLPGVYNVNMFLYDKSGNAVPNTMNQSVSVFNYKETDIKVETAAPVNVFTGDYTPFQVHIDLSWQDYVLDEPSTIFLAASGSKSKPYDTENRYAHLIPYNAFYENVSGMPLPGNKQLDLTPKYFYVKNNKVESVGVSTANTLLDELSAELLYATSPTSGSYFYYYDDLPTNRVDILISVDTSKHQINDFYVENINIDQNRSGLNYLETPTAGADVKSQNQRKGFSLRVNKSAPHSFSFTSTGMPEMSAIQYKRQGDKFQVLIGVRDRKNNILKYYDKFKYTTNVGTITSAADNTFYVEFVSGNATGSGHSAVSSLSTNKFPYNTTTEKTELSSFLYTNINPTESGTWTIYVTGKNTDFISLTGVTGSIGSGTGNVGIGTTSSSTNILTGSYTFTIAPSTNSSEVYKINEDIDYSQTIKSYRFQSFMHEYDKLFDGIFTSFVGEASSSPTVFGKTVFEKIANFVGNNNDVDVCNIKNITSFYDFLNEEINLLLPEPPPELKRLYDLFSIKISKLIGGYERFDRNFDTQYYTTSAISRNINLNSKITTSSYVVSAGTPFVAKQRFNDEYILIRPQKIPTYYTDGSSTGETSSYSLSVYNQFGSNWGWALDTTISGASGLDTFYEFYPYTTYDTTSSNENIKNSVIDFNNTYNTVTRGVTSLSGSWDNDGGIVYNNLDYQIRKGLLL